MRVNVKVSVRGRGEVRGRVRCEGRVYGKG